MMSKGRIDSDFVPNEYEVLRKWLMFDLESCRKNIRDVKEQERILRLCVQNLKIFSGCAGKYSSKVLVLLEAIKSLGFVEAMEKISKLLSFLFVEICFSRDIYNQQLANITGKRPWKEFVKTRARFADPLNALDFFVKFRRFQEMLALPLVDKCSVLVRSVLCVFQDWSQKRNDFGEGGRLHKFKLNEFLFSSSTSSVKFPGDLVVNPEAKHVSILVDSYLFKLDIYNEHGHILSLNETKEQLLKIFNQWKIAQKGVDTSSRFRNTGALTFGNRDLCHKSRIELIQYDERNSHFFETLDTSICVFCFDLSPDHDLSSFSSPPPKISEIPTIEEINESIKEFTRNCQNRWFGQTQIIISENFGDIFAYFPFSKGIGGHYSIFVSETFQNRMNQILEEELEGKEGRLSSQKYFEEIPLIWDHDTSTSNSLNSINEPSYPQQYFHLENSIFRVPFGSSFFKERNLSPNISINILFALSMIDVVGEDLMKHLSYAVGLKCKNLTRHIYWENFNLDLCRQIKESDNFSESLKKAELFEVERMRLCKEGLSPTHILSLNDDDDDDDNSVNSSFRKLLVSLLFQGDNYVNFFHGFEYYLFANFRGDFSGNMITNDVRTSSMPFGKSLITLGRPGSYLHSYTYFGVHICIRENETDFIFMPKKGFEKKLTDVVERWEKFASMLM